MLQARVSRAIREDADGEPSRCEQSPAALTEEFLPANNTNRHEWLYSCSREHCTACVREDSWIDMARVLALDIGEKRIGVAVSDESQRLARPLATIVRASKREDFEEVARLIAEDDAERLIVGLPQTLR